MNTELFSPVVQAYLQAHSGTDPVALALGKSPFATVSAKELAQQVDGRQRIRRKLPEWYNTPGIYYPEKLALEQSSSEATARYKARLIPPGIRLADLTGGLGIDAHHFAQRAASVVHCERNGALSAIAAHNAAVLGTTNIDFHVTDGIAYADALENDGLDMVYIDPSRRVEQRKVFLLEDCEPNVVSQQDMLLRKAATVFIKCAPMLDISAARAALRHVREIHVVSVDNECKESLFILDRDHEGQPRIVAASLAEGTVRTFAFSPEAEQSAVATLAPPETYLYEPDAALLKAGAFKLAATRYGLKKLHRHTHLYTSTEHVADFIGKTFTIAEVVPYGKFKKQRTGLQAHVSTRNFPLKPEEIRKRHRIQEGGDLHLYFCTGADDVPMVIFASKS